MRGAMLAQRWNHSVRRPRGRKPAARAGEPDFRIGLAASRILADHERRSTRRPAIIGEMTPP